MAIKIKLDAAGNPEQLRLILSTRTGNKIRILPAEHVRFSADLSNGSEISFSVSKAACVKRTGEIDEGFWKQITDFKLCYCPEIDRWYELTVSVDEKDQTIKNCVATSLGEAELSQVNVYDIEVNTETDIERDDYRPTVLYNKNDPGASLLDRLLYKAPHYRIGTVDDSIENIQRSFSFDGKSVRDCFNEIAEEIGCLFVYECGKTDEFKIDRCISVYDLECKCLDCGARGEFYGVCEKCGSTNITPGYGEDTSIFVSTDNLASEIQYETDTGSVKNCFRLEAGDDLMTATVMNCNPNGSQYLWYIPDWMKDDMPEELSQKLDDYDGLFEYYQNESVFTPDSAMRTEYNRIVTKYIGWNGDPKWPEDLPATITGYPNLMHAYYNAIDLEMFLDHELMPSVEISSTSAAAEAAKLTAANLSPIAVAKIDTCTASIAASAAQGMAKCLVDTRYQVKLNGNGTYVPAAAQEGVEPHGTWTGNFIVTNYSDEDDTAESAVISVTVDGDQQTYIQQKIDRMVAQTCDDATDISALFKMGLADFTTELVKYARQRLLSFREAAQASLDILIQQGVADQKSWADTDADHNLYNKMYLPYRAKMAAVEAEIAVRDGEIAVVAGTYDDNGALLTEGVEAAIQAERRRIQKALDFEGYLGTELWHDFAAYRREDTFQNQNYISDGLDNAELFRNAQTFLSTAETEIYKSAMLQHTISATMQNLLIMPEFEPLKDKFELGNRIRIRADGRVWRLRLATYEIDYDSWKLDVSFTDVREGYNAAADVQNILNMAKSMSSSYASVSRQAEKGSDSSRQITSWTDRGFSLTTRIIGGAQNQEFDMGETGITGREYIQETDEYSDEQIKIINSGVYVTRDGWLTAEAGLGHFIYYDPQDKVTKDGFGVIAKTLVGSLLLTEKVGVYNAGGTVKIDQNGFTLTTSASGNTSVFTIQRQGATGEPVPIMSINADGELVLNGDIITGSLQVGVIKGAIEGKGYAADTNSWKVDFTNGTLKIGNISADSITAGTLSADIVSTISLSVSQITGTLESEGYSGDTSKSWKIDFTNGTMTIGNINADKIKAGSLSADRISGGTINCNNINVTNINGQNITKGTVKGGVDNRGRPTNQLAANTVTGGDNGNIAHNTVTGGPNGNIASNTVSSGNTDFSGTLNQVGTNKSNIEAMQGYFTGSATFSNLKATIIWIGDKYLGFDSNNFVRGYTSN